MTAHEIHGRLLALQDNAYRTFQLPLIPTVAPESVIGVRTPALRALAKELRKTAVADAAEAAALETFLAALPHQYFDENQLHALIISLEKDFSLCIQRVEAFLPFINNWATCDQLSPAAFKKAEHRESLLAHIQAWLASATADNSAKPTAAQAYTARFAIGMLMQHFLGDSFAPWQAALVAAVRLDHYYVRMMQAWYFATALAKQYDAALPFIADRALAPWTHNKAIQKACESFRVTDEHKSVLRALR